MRRMMMSTTAAATSPQIDQLFTVAEARFDRWRKLLDVARAWQANQARPGRGAPRDAVLAAFAELRQWEDFFAFPGRVLLSSLEQRISLNDSAGPARLVQS